MKGAGPTHDQRIELAADVLKRELRRYHIKGSSENFDGGPPYKAPWMLIDVSKAEPEVNWPGELIGEYDEPGKASDEMFRRTAETVLAALALQAA